MQVCNKHNEEITMICLESSCKFHLICVQCLIEDHAEHPDLCLIIEEIQNKQNVNDNNELVEQINQLQKPIQTENFLDKGLRDIQNEILQKFDIFENDLKLFYSTQVSKDLQEIEQQFIQTIQSATDTKETINIINQLKQGDITLNEFNIKLKEILNLKADLYRNIQINYNILKRQSLKLNKKDFQSIQQEILNIINEIPKTLNIDKQLTFEIFTGQRSQIENGNTVIINPLDTQFAAATLNTFSYPNKHIFTIKIEYLGVGPIKQFQIGFAHYTKPMNYNYFCRQASSSYFDIYGVQRGNFWIQKPEGKNIADQIRLALKEKKPALLELTLDIENYYMTLKFEDIKMEYSKKKLPKIGGNIISLESFFSKNKKYVLFLLASQEDVKCQIY